MARALINTIPGNPDKMSDEMATKMGRKIYLGDGTTYKDGNAATITDGTLVGSQLVPYQMQDGSWRLKFNITIYPATPWDSASDGYAKNISITGVTFKNISNMGQGLAVAHNSTYSKPIRGSTNPNSNQLSFTGTINSGKLNISGDVALESKPDWAY